MQAHVNAPHVFRFTVFRLLLLLFVPDNLGTIASSSSSSTAAAAAAASLFLAWGIKREDASSLPCDAPFWRGSVIISPPPSLGHRRKRRGRQGSMPDAFVLGTIFSLSPGNKKGMGRERGSMHAWEREEQEKETSDRRTVQGIWFCLQNWPNLRNCKSIQIHIGVKC